MEAEPRTAAVPAALTSGYYKRGVSYGHIAEVNGVEEAQEILRYYRRIIQNIKKQLGESGYIKTAEDIDRNIS